MFLRSKVSLQLLLVSTLSVLFACGGDKAQQSDSSGADHAAESGHVEFKGKIAREYANSKEWWPETFKTAPKGAPNVVMILLDDTGFGQLGSYGGLTDTPNLDALANGGLRFNNFHTTALCSPSRASLMAGRNPHSIGLGSHSLTAMGFPGYNAIIPENAKSVAKVLQQNGYVNYALGKWDHTPLNEVSQTGPFTRWPSGEGFDHFYGFMAADADQYRTVMFEDHAPVEPWKQAGEDYHNSEDLAQKAIKYITGHVSTAPDRPFMVFMAPGGMHSPHQAPQEYLDKYKGKFDMGWDEARNIILAKQKSLGIVPQNTQLTARAEDIPAWDSLNDDERKLYARQMEVFAAMLDHLDAQIGKVVAALKRVGQYDNTLIIVTSDNGASGEGGLAGTFNETYVLNGLQTAFDANMRRYDTWGDRNTYPHYHAAWAMADLGISAVIAPSFSDIFSGNAFKNGLLAIVLPQDAIDRLIEVAQTDSIHIDLETQTVTTPFQDRFAFEIDPFRKHCLINGVDEIGLTLKSSDAISTYETKISASQPWLTPNIA